MASTMNAKDFLDLQKKTELEIDSGIGLSSGGSAVNSDPDSDQRNFNVDSGFGSAHRNPQDSGASFSVFSSDEGLTSLTDTVAHLVLDENRGKEVAIDDNEHAKRLKEYVSHAFEVDDDNDTYLHIALFKNMRTEAELMIRSCRAPANLNIQNNYGQTPLHIAAYLDNVRHVMMLLLLGARIDLVDAGGKTAFHHVAERGHFNTLKMIIEFFRRADQMAYCLNVLSMADYEGNTAFALAVKSKQKAICKMLVEAIGAEVTKSNIGTGDSPLHQAVDDNNVDPHFIYSLITECGLNVNAVNMIGLTPLHIAAARGDEAVCSLLLLFGADKNVRDLNGNIPWDYAQNEEIQNHLKS